MNSVRKALFFVAILVSAFLIAGASEAQANDCEIGDEKCGPRGYVMYCTHVTNANAGVFDTWWRTDFNRECDRPNYAGSTKGKECTYMDEKCSPDGYVMTCQTTGRTSPRLKWQNLTASRCK